MKLNSQLHAYVLLACLLSRFQQPVQYHYKHSCEQNINHKFILSCVLCPSLSLHLLLVFCVCGDVCDLIMIACVSLSVSRCLNVLLSTTFVFKNRISTLTSPIYSIRRVNTLNYASHIE